MELLIYLAIWTFATITPGVLFYFAHTTMVIPIALIYLLGIWGITLAYFERKES